MSSLSFPNLAVPDMNIWLALASPEHIHYRQALHWWQFYAGSIAFCRLSQLGILRLMTTAAAMDGKPLGKFGSAGKLAKEFGTVNEIDCPAGITASRCSRANAGPALLSSGKGRSCQVIMEPR